MPRYEYRCEDCDRIFERVRPMSEASEPAVCDCGRTSPRVISRIAPQWDRMERVGDPGLLDD